MQVLDHRPETLQQAGSSADFLSEVFSKTFREDLVFRACLIVGSILLRLKTVTICFKLNIFHNNFTGNVYIQCYS